MKSSANNDGTVDLNLTHRRDTDEGICLKRMYYRTQLIDLIDVNSRLVCISDNGVSHSLLLMRMRPEDIISWLVLVEEDMGHHSKAFIRDAMKKLKEVPCTLN